MATYRRITDATGKTVGWEAQILLGRDPVTKKKRFTSHRAPLKGDAVAWAESLQTDRRDGKVRPTTKKVTLAEYLRQTWLPNYATQVRNIYNVEKTLGKWVLTPQPDTPFLGWRPLLELAGEDFNHLYRAMTAQGLQPRAIAYLHGLLKRALKAAVIQKPPLLTSNPLEGVKPPKKGRTTITSEADERVGPVEYLSREQAQRFLAVAKTDRWCALWYLLLDAGLRPGEAFALQWRHIDWDRSLVKVRGTLVRQGVPKRAGECGWLVTAPKTESSKGDVPVSAATLAELKRWKALQAEERLRLGPEWQDYGFIFTTETGTPLGNNMGRVWTRVLAQADGGKGDLGTWGPVPQKPRSGPTPARTFTPRFCLYVLRHTCATLALLDGVDLLQVSRRLRHKNITITAQFYGHLKAEHTTQAAASFDRLAVGVP